MIPKKTSEPGSMTPRQRAEHYAAWLDRAYDRDQAAAEIAAQISTLFWVDKPGRPGLKYEEKLDIVRMMGEALVGPPADEMTRLGGDNSRTLALIQAIRAMIR